MFQSPGSIYTSWEWLLIVYECKINAMIMTSSHFLGIEPMTLALLFNCFSCCPCLVLIMGQQQSLSVMKFIYPLSHNTFVYAFLSVQY